MASKRTTTELLRRKSDPGSCKLANEAVVAAELPWGALKVVSNMAIDFGVLPAKFSAQSLLLELFGILERKIQHVSQADEMDKLLNKSLRKGEDPYFDNLLRTLSNISETCLPSILTAVIRWYENQQKIFMNDAKDERDQTMKRFLAAGYLFCILLIELLPQVQFHPTECESSVSYLLNLSFQQVAYREPSYFGANYNNSLVVSEIFAEVIGVLSQSHFRLVQKTFFSILNELRKETPLTSSNLRQIISLLMGMKFFRIKTNQVSDLEAGVNFLDELGSYYLEVDLKQKDLKHAIAGLLVEILLPVAAQIKTEANVPSLIAFVDKMYSPTYDLINKKQHKMAAYPLLTCLLCISQSKFFLSNWVQFLNTTLANLKNRDSKVSRVALESLYRLIWVYIIRNNCEGNTATRSRLESICSSLFPRGNRNVIPREAPLNIFVKIIHFIAQQKLDFAFKEIIFDLLGCNRASKSVSIYPERMNIGIRALMVIADGLQQKEGPPGMPRSIGPVASGTIQRVKKTYISRPLTADIARAIGLEQYYLPCRKAFDSILRTLDIQVGRSLMLTASQTRGKEPSELIVGDVKPKLDLFRTCIAAIPRLLPDPMSHHDLFDLLTRMSVHMDMELQQTVYQTIQNLISECPEWREDIIQTYLNFLTNQIQDTFPVLLESSVRFLYQLICAWKSAAQFEKKREQQNIQQQQQQPTVSITKPNNNISAANLHRTSYPLGNANQEGRSPIQGHTSGAYSDGGSPGTRYPFSPVYNNVSAHVLHCVEGFALVLLCQLKTHTKKLAIGLLKEVKSLLAIVAPEHHDTPVIDVLDDATPYVLNKYIEHVPLSERQTWTPDLASACDKICNLEPDNCLVNSDKGNEYLRWDPWACALSGYSEYRFLWTKCPTAVSSAYPALYARLSTCNQFVDPNNPQNESRASLLRSSKSKATSSSLCGESLTQDSYLSLWQKYLVMCCALAPPPPQAANPITRSFSPSTTMELDLVRNMTSSLRLGRIATSSTNCTLLFQKIGSMVRWEHMTDMRDSVVLGLGSTNPACIDYLLEELSNKGILRECLERKPESNVRRRKRKDLLRLQVLRIIEVAVFRGAIEFGALVDSQSSQLSQVTLEILDSIRYHVEFEHTQERDMAILTSLRLHFAKTLTLIINSMPLDRRANLITNDRKYTIFSILFNWFIRNSSPNNGNVGAYVEQKAVQAMCSLLCSGPMFSIRPINDEDYVYRYLELLFPNSNLIVPNICEETLSTMLYLNDQNTHLFDWTVQMCYEKPNLFSTRCFKALAMLFSQREFACDFIPIFVLCQVFVSDSDLVVREAAFLLIHVLRRQFLDDNLAPSTSELLNDSSDASMKTDNDHSLAPKLYQNTQYDIIRQLARTYPQLTMPVFSEVCSRIESARPYRQSAMLTFLVSWLENIELVDSHCEIFGGEFEDPSHGWGSEEATQLLLNNLLYLTTKFASEHNYEIMELWKCLASTFPSNLPILVHYLFVMMSLSPDTIVPVAKRISEYLLAATGERFVSILMDQLNGVVEQFKMILTRSEMPPYYRWQPTNSESEENNEEKEKSKTKSPPLAVEKVVLDEMVTSTHKYKNSAPRQLPMPAYGGFYANLSTLLPHSTQPVLYFTRHNLAMFLMSDLIGFAAGEASSIDWERQLVQLLHLSLLGLDSTRPIVCRYSRRSLVNLCLLYAGPAIQMDQVASILLSNELFARNEVFEKYQRSNYQIGSSYNMSSDFSIRPETPTFASLSPEDCRKALLFSNDAFDSSTNLLCSICCLLSDKPERWLWNNEEVSSRCWRIESAEQLGCFVGHLVEFFVEPVPHLPIKWTEFGMKLALSTNSRHVAGRSFQVISALGQNPTPHIGQMLSRLVEMVGEHNEDAQCYITHMLLCIMALVPAFQLSAANENKPPTSPSGHNRSISYTPALIQQNATQNAHKSVGTSSTTSPSHSNHQIKKDARHSLLIENEAIMFPPPQLSRSKSATTLKLNCLDTNEEQMNAFSQLLAISIALMESHVDNEFLLGLNLFDKLIDATTNDNEMCLQRLEKLINQLDWNGFPGLVGLISKGTIYSSGYEISVSLLTKCIALLNLSIMGSVDTFTIIVISILPYCLHNFESLIPSCISAAQAIAQFCNQKLTQLVKDSPDVSPNDHPLQNLATMMNQYKERSFPRDRFQWAKCVANYLIDAFKPNIVQNIVFMAEMLEKTIPQFHVYLLHMIYLFISHSDDLNDASPVPINGQVLRAVTKHIQGINWREAARIFKCVVDQWNSISITQVLGNEIPVNQTKPNFELYVERPSFEEASSPQTPRKMTGTQLAANNVDSLRRQNASSQSKVRERLISLLTASGMQVGLPKSSSMIFSQSTNDIYHESTVGGTTNMNIKTGASNSAYSSSERISHQDELESGSSLVAVGVDASSITTDSFPRVFKEFDFLEAEHDSISESNESCFNWLSTLRPRCEIDQNEEVEDGIADEHDDDFLNPGEDEEDEDDVDLRVTMGRNIRMRNPVPRRGGKSAMHPRRPLSGASDSNDISSDRTPVQSEQASDDSSPSCPVTDEEEDHEDEENDLEVIAEDESKSQEHARVPSSLAETASTYPIGGDDTMFASLETASSVQCRSEFSIQNGNSYAQNKPPIYLECNHHISGQVEQVWVSFVNDIANEQDGGTTSHSIMLFSQLFRECCVKLSSLLRDACHCINMSSSQHSQSPRDLSAYFTQALNVVLKVADCPILFVTPQFLHSSNLLQTHKFALYELLEHYETFIERKEQCIRALNAVKSSLKLMLLSPTSSTTSIGGVNQEVELCKSLHKLFFQLLLMLEKLNDMIKAITSSANSQEFDLSPAVLCLHRELLACTSELPPSELRMSSNSLSASRTDQSVDTLVLHLTNKNYKSALMTLRQLRNQFGSNQYGCCDHVDIEVLLIQFCRAHTMRTWAIVGSMPELQRNCTSLRQICGTLSALVRTLLSDVGTGSLRSSRLSSVNESSGMNTT